MADESPATKRDVQDLRVELKQDAQDLRVSLKQDIQDLRAEVKQDVQDLKAGLEKMETRLLTEFWKWARTNDIKIRTVSNHGVDLDARLNLVEERVSELERRRPTS
jgi:hypothetical protein